jgi:hypothetical protein
VNSTRKARAFIAAGLFVLYFSSAVDAAGPLGAEGSRIQTSDYRVDLFQGPVLASSRITALSGAFTAIGEGTEAIPFNPAAASFRPPYSTTKNDWDLTAGLTLPSSVTNTDFDNNGKVGFRYDKFFFASAGGLYQFGRLGLGLILGFQNYSLGVLGQPIPLAGSDRVVATFSVRLIRIEPVLSYALLDNQLHLGGGLRMAAFYGVGETGVVGGRTDQEVELLNSNTLGAQVGALWAPHNLPLRVGGAARTPMTALERDPGRITPNAEGDSVVGNVYLPNRVDLPWEVELGAAVQLWKRPFNIPWHDEAQVPPADTERYRQTQANGAEESQRKGAHRLLMSRYNEIPRERVTLMVSTLVSGPVQNAVGFESMLTQTVERSGEQTVVTVRGGVESEVIPSWLVVRGGSYLEPSRYRAGESRVHGTAGFALRVLRWSVFGLFDDDTLFRFSGAVDLSRDYFGWSVGAGLFR